MQMISIDQKTIETAQQSVISNLTALNDSEKWALSHAALLLYEQQSIDLDALHSALSINDRKAINDCINAGVKNWYNQLCEVCQLDHVPVGMELGCAVVENEMMTMFGAITGGGYAIDLEPMKYLSVQDAEIVADCLAEIKTLLLDAPMPTSLIGYGSMEEEYLDEFADWLPKELNNADENTLMEYWSEHCEDFEGGSFSENDDWLVVAYVQRRGGLPKWTERIDGGIGNKRPKDAINRLEEVINKVQHEPAKDFVKECVRLMTHFMRHFENNEQWRTYHSSFENDRAMIETDDTYIDLGFMLTWGGEGYWWDICNNIYTMMMEAGENPTHFARANDEESRQRLAINYERIALGAGLLEKYAVMSNELRPQAKVA